MLQTWPESLDNGTARRVCGQIFVVFNHSLSCAIIFTTTCSFGSPIRCCIQFLKVSPKLCYNIICPSSSFFCLMRYSISEHAIIWTFSIEQHFDINGKNICWQPCCFGCKVWRAYLKYSSQTCLKASQIFPHPRSSWHYFFPGYRMIGNEGMIEYT